MHANDLAVAGHDEPNMRSHSRKTLFTLSRKPEVGSIPAPRSLTIKLGVETYFAASVRAILTLRRTVAIMQTDFAKLCEEQAPSPSGSKRAQQRRRDLFELGPF